MAVNNSLQKSKGNQRLGLTAYLSREDVKGQINKAIGGENSQRFISAIISATTTNTMLQEM